MRSPIPLRCQCGLVRGQIDGLTSSGWNRFVCLCDDCQAYAHALGQADRVLESDGGTEITPVAPCDLKILSGSDQIRCLKLTEKGLDRWFTACCKTPIGNTPNANVPYIGVVHNFIYLEGQSREDLLGPVRARIQGKFGKRPLKPGTSESAPPSVILSMIRYMIPAYLFGKKRPHPFYDEKGRPLVPPEILNTKSRS